jgi:biotin synthase
LHKHMVRRRILEVLHAGEKGTSLSFDDLLLLLSITRKEELELLFATADRVRRKFVGNDVHLRGILEFSNTCVQNCRYCGLRRDNRTLSRYRMNRVEIVEAAQEAKSRGLKTLVLQSGEDPWYTRKGISGLIREIKDSTGLTITLSLGERPHADYEEWRKAGADRYLLKQETASPRLFRRLRPGRRLKDRLNCLRVLKGLGYEVGSGNIVGLPGQAGRDLAKDIQVFLEYNFDMIGIGPFIPHPQTPLREARPGDLCGTLKVLAVTRIVTRNTNLPATTATGVLNPDGRRKALLAGANVIMPDITPRIYRLHYQLYPGKSEVEKEKDEIGQMISSLGRGISRGAGYRCTFRPP